MQKSVETYFDVAAVEAQQEIIQKSQGVAQKKAITALHKIIETGLHKMAAEVAEQIGIQAPPLNGRKRA